MKKTTRLTTLPIELVEKVKELNLSPKEFNSAIRFIDILKSKSYRKYKLYDSSIQLPSKYIGKVFGKKSLTWFTKLKESGVVNCTLNKDGKETYSKQLGICKSYNLNSTYFFNNPFTYSSSTYNQYPLITYMCPLFEENESQQGFQELKSLVVEDLKELVYDFDKLRDIATKKINDISLDNYLIDEAITTQFMPVIIKKDQTQYKYWMTRENALRIAKEDGLTLIQDKKVFYITNADEFIIMKKNVFRDAYLGSIEKIEKKYWYADRNSTNNRLDSNITNLCSDLMKEIIESNDLVQFDLANSQFAILSHILKQDEKLNCKSDFKAFKELCETGELYSHIQSELSLKTRKEGKIMLFELLFSSEKNRSENKKKVSKLFPSVVEWIDEYKKANGYEQFSVMLQKEESKIFIDDIWMHFKNNDIFCLTKHDSIIVRKKDSDMAEEFLQEYFDSINFTAKIVK